jgi:HAMP domain-containing protein
MGTSLYLVCLSPGLLAGTFVYVLTDRLVSRTLIANGLTCYPRDLREGRQSVKMLIIPVVMTIISVLYSLSAALLVVSRAGGSIRDLSGGDRTALAALVAFLLLVVLVLAFTLKRSTSALFDAVIEQLENLSSAKKDLSRRIFICSVDEVGTIAGMVNGFCENVESGMREIKGGQHEPGFLGGGGDDREYRLYRRSYGKDGRPVQDRGRRGIRGKRHAEGKRGADRRNGVPVPGPAGG